MFGEVQGFKEGGTFLFAVLAAGKADKIKIGFRNRFCRRIGRSGLIQEGCSALPQGFFQNLLGHSLDTKFSFSCFLAFAALFSIDIRNISVLDLGRGDGSFEKIPNQETGAITVG